MLKTDRPSSYVSYGEEYEKQRTRAGHLASEWRRGERGRAMRRRGEKEQRPVCYLRAEKDSRALNQMEDNNRP